MNVDYMLTHWQAVRSGLMDTIGKFRDSDLTFRPFASAWTVRQLMLHIAQEENGEFNYGIRQVLPEFPAEYPADAHPTVSAIKIRLNKVHEPVLAYLQSLNDADLQRHITTPWGPNYRLIDMLGHMVEHEIHHRAELSLILGMLGREGLNA
jgi:uncharacterized damage-inducible protein DinB